LGGSFGDDSSGWNSFQNERLNSFSIFSFSILHAPKKLYHFCAIPGIPAYLNCIRLFFLSLRFKIVSKSYQNYHNVTFANAPAAPRSSERNLPRGSTFINRFF
jgi:hypothetical protein